MSSTTLAGLAQPSPCTSRPVHGWSPRTTLAILTWWRRLLYHTGYWHEGCDVEFAATARSRGTYAFAADSIVEHLHPLWGKARTTACTRDPRARGSRPRAPTATQAALGAV